MRQPVLERLPCREEAGGKFRHSHSFRDHCCERRSERVQIARVREEGRVDRGGGSPKLKSGNISSAMESDSQC